MNNISTRKERESEFKKQLIAEAAKKLFAKSSFETVTVEEIAREAEFGKGTIYQYFSSKEEILVYVICQGLEKLCSHMEEECGPRTEAINAITCYVELQYMFYHAYSRLFLSMLRRQFDGNLSDELFTRVKERHAVKMKLAAELLQRGQKAGLVMAGDCLELARIFDNIIKAFNLGDIERNTMGDPQNDLVLIKKVLSRGIVKDLARADV